MSGFSANQAAFLRAFSAASGVNPGVAAAWMAAEEPVGAQSGDHGTQDWLNVGMTDSASLGTGNSVWTNPTKAGEATGKWLKGEWSDPGFGTASSGIQQITKLNGNPQAQIHAIQNSGWASSGYPDLPGLYSTYASEGQKIAGSKGGVTAPIGGTTGQQQPSQVSIGGNTIKIPGVTTVTHTPNWQEAGIQAFLNAAPKNTPGVVNTGTGMLGALINDAHHDTITTKTTTPGQTESIGGAAPTEPTAAPTPGNALPHTTVPDNVAKLPNFVVGTSDVGPGKTVEIAQRLDELGSKLGVKIYSISAYRTPAHSVAVGGFADDPHTKGLAIDIGVNGESRASAAQLTNAQLASVGLWRPFDMDGQDPAEVNHVQLIGTK